MQPMPRVLLVEDDPVSRVVLEAAVARCGFAVDSADGVRAALSKAAPARHSLWLIDAHLPDGTGIELLAALRAIDPEPAAIAHTASPDAGTGERLRCAGFVDVLVKPLAAQQIADALQGWLPASACPAAEATAPETRCDEPPLWDDAAALRALNGQREHTSALRALFIGELAAAADRVAAALRRHDAAALRSELHRLRASCGFVGAARMGAAVRALEMHRDEDALHRFEATVDATLAAAAGHQPG